VIKFHAEHLGAKVTKKDARTISLTREQYLKVKYNKAYCSLDY
jgi:hypothetical protein